MILQFLLTTLFAIPEKMSPEHTAIYNQLPEVEDADIAIKQRESFTQFLTDFSGLVKRHGLEDMVGLRLIHKHFTLDTNPDNQQVMCEDYAQIDGVDSLVTQSQKISDVFKKAYAASWIFNEKEETGVPFEYSSDPAVAQARDKIDATTSFFKEAQDIITGCGYADLLSLAILKRNKLLSTSQDQSLLERSHLGDSFRYSVVQMVNNKNIGPDDIKTAWSFGDTKEGFCVYAQYCQRVGQSGHIQVHAHI